MEKGVLNFKVFTKYWAHIGKKVDHKKNEKAQVTFKMTNFGAIR